MKKEGQFYLIATVIIIAVIMGFLAVSNYAKNQDSSRVYDLGEELNIEGENILDYGTYNDLSKNETAALLQDFIEIYSEHIGEDVDVYLLVGDENSIIVIGQEGLEENVEIDFGMTGDVSKNLKKFARKEYFPEGGSSGNKIKVKIRKNAEESDEYEFDLKDGESFYFIISQSIGEGTHVTTS